ncbi:glyoxylate dehydrogenase [Coniophora puteana RWD-64-598 SS2]|uniref:L-lactate dehydrogenase (cytochrome) n=1 Tax=Coniophora puteana (strain RWD-64-598) TaxID=741705 RepID=A0A5M3MNU8_CONPW|nr:glyoxylate dehydrogenase [Coniophora puteana RWD-64-598 SS2]EIW80311.1 glyoxylate dehydrogenase [Coniophora puteana RWD-64-598 SS2]
MSLISSQQVAEHSSAESCWIIVHGKVYDVTQFLPEHPGGSRIILKYAGQDATEAYDPIHPPDAITTHLPKDKHLGAVDPKTIIKVVKEVTAEEKRRQELLAARPSLDEIVNLHDFEAVAKAILPAKAWAYYSSASDDEITIRENRAAYQRIWFRPRVLRDVSTVSWATTILGQKSSLPVYISATALGKLGHPDGELNLTRAAGKHGVIQMIPTLASCSFDEIVDAAVPGQVQFLQLYVNRDREITKRYVQHAEKRGVKGLFITVDAPQLGRREKDMRMKVVDEGGVAKVQDGQGDIKKDEGVARAISSFIDPSLSWKDIPWFKSITNMPIVLKGVATPEDALLAYDYGVAGIVLSNHGGRQLDTARSGIENLIEVVEALKTRGPWPNPRFSVFVDGGIRRASDVLKAIALGASAVGVGRAFMYSFSAYGQEGVEKAFQIFREELEMNMRLIGARTIDELEPSMVDASGLSSHVGFTPIDNLYNTTYQPLALAQFKTRL